MPWENKALEPGAIYNNRIVIKQVETGDRSHRYYLVRCQDCKTERTLTKTNIVKCGCMCLRGGKNTLTKLATAATKAPVGSRFGAWTVVSSPFLAPDRWSGNARVDCECDCGAVRAVRVTSLISTGTRQSRSCGIQKFHLSEASAQSRKNKVAQARYKGIAHPRTPGSLRTLFASEDCGFIRCPNPVAVAKMSVDHSHDICEHKKNLACPECARALVHQSCNIIIAHWEWAIKENLHGIPDDIVLFLTTFPFQSTDHPRAYPKVSTREAKGLIR